MQQYEAIGASLSLSVRSCLPKDWDWRARRALDFGCGAGRVLRHFADEAQSAEFWGCDIDGPSIAWLRERLCPPFHAFLVEETPGLARADEYFDVVWAMSVFTHSTDNWAGWLLELHRVLKPGGYLIATFMGANMAAEVLGESWDENRVGMNVVGAGRPWSQGGPLVFHSEWWVRAHWGRAFEVIQYQANAAHPGTHGLMVLRKRPTCLTIAELEQPEPGEPRELAAARHNIQQLHAEDRRVRELQLLMDHRPLQLVARLARRWGSRARARLRQISLDRRQR
ncbi:MAG: class I SAM-dependent methyltransferase [Actinomycetota bacterium]|nr:class I SAM-dependent methyltransferase [Actinomycetota bacterium]